MYLVGRYRTAHQIARDFGHEELFQFLMRHSPQDLKLAQACELGDEELFRGLLASRPNLIQTLSDGDWRRLTDAAQNNNTAAVRLILAAGSPMDTTCAHCLPPLHRPSCHTNTVMVR